MKTPYNPSLSYAVVPDNFSYHARLSDILSAANGSKSLILAIYLVEQNNFLYCSENFEALLGAKMDILYKRGWDFWFSNISPSEALPIKNKLRNFLLDADDRSPLVLRYHIKDMKGERIYLKHEMALHRKRGLLFTLNYFFDISGKERIEHYLGDISSHEGIDDGPKPISQREEEVLRLVADGFSSKEIADMLFISNHTAISHRKNLIEKFGVKNTAQLIKSASKIMEL